MYLRYLRWVKVLVTKFSSDTENESLLKVYLTYILNKKFSYNTSARRHCFISQVYYKPYNMDKGYITKFFI